MFIVLNLGDTFMTKLEITRIISRRALYHYR